MTSRRHLTGRFLTVQVVALVVLCLAVGLTGSSRLARAGDAGGTAPASAPTAPAAAGPSPSGLPLPRFVSLKSDRVNLRAGPGTEYPTSWVFRRAGLPLEVIKEFEGWRQVRDAEGTTGWVLQSFLSGRRTALVTPWDVKTGDSAPQIPIMKSDSSASRKVALVEAGVIANVQSCDSAWCEISAGNYKGFIEQKKLWGVYDGEVLR
jgi:SH3-like domain-containing protein